MPTCPRPWLARGRGGEHPWDAGVGVSSLCGDTPLPASGRCSESAWWGRRHRDGMWHRDRTRHGVAYPAAHSGERPTGGTRVPTEGRDPLVAPASPQTDETRSEQQHFIATGLSMGEKVLQPLPWGISQPLGLGHVASWRASPIPTLIHQAGKMSLQPTGREGGPAPKGAQALQQGCPLVMVFHHRACCQKEPVFPTQTWPLVPS